MPLSAFAKLRHILVPAIIVFGVLAAAIVGYMFFRSVPGQVRLDGEVLLSQDVITAKMSGVVSTIEVSPGQQIFPGQILLRFDSGPLQQVFEQEQRRLADLTGMLPPQYVFLPDPDRPEASRESLAQRLERQRAEEVGAEREMHEASLNEAKLSVTHNRIRMLVAQGKLNPDQQRLSDQSLDAAKEHTSLAQKRFEENSLKRSGTDALIRRLLEAQKASGADRIPLQERLRRFEEQSFKVAELADRVQNAVITAPFEGVVQEILVSSGDPVQSTQPCFTVRKKDAPMLVRATVMDKEKYSLKKGLACEMLLEGHENEPVQGYVSFLSSGAEPESADIPVLECRPLQSSQLAGLVGGKVYSRSPHAELTIFLDRMAYQNPSPGTMEKSAFPEEDDWQGASRATASGRISANGSASPDAVSQQGRGAVNNPEAASLQRTAPEAVVIKSGSPEAVGKLRESLTSAPGPTGSSIKDPVQLPPMKAPYPLKGSPLPDVHNNPSIVPPAVLEPAPTRP